MKLSRIILSKSKISVLMFLVISLSLLTFSQAKFAFAFFDPHGNYNLSTEGCALCHPSHAATGPLLFEATNQKNLCYSCHDGTRSIYNVKGEFGETVLGSTIFSSAHPVPNGVQVCTNCHNPHLANSSNPQLLAVGDTPVSTGNAVCGECHGPETEVVGGDLLTPFAGSPHDTAVTNPVSGTEIKCIRCHQPHGSTIKPLLQNTIVSQTGGTSEVTGNNNTVCFGCHNNAKGGYSGKTVYNTTFHGNNPANPSTKALNTYPGTSYEGTLCLNCHEPHGKTGISMYRRADGNTLCTNCHDDASVVRPATYSYRGITTYDDTPHATAVAPPRSSIYHVESTGAQSWESFGLANEAPTPSDPGTPATVGEKGDAASVNDVFWSTGSATVEGSYNFQMYKFKVMQNLADIKELRGKWVGYGEPTPGYTTDLLIWNNVSLAWDPLASALLGDPNSPGTLSWTVSADVQNYLDASNNLYILARAQHDGTGPIISNLSISNGVGYNQVVNFTTSENATSEIAYGTTPGVYTLTSIEGTFGTTHAVTLGSLVSDTTYYYKITTVDKLGNQTEYTDQFFTAYTPSTPTGLVGPVVDPAPGGNPTVNFSWTASTDQDPTDTITYEWKVLVNGTPYSAGTTATNSVGVYLDYTDGPYTVSWQIRAKDQHDAYSAWSAFSSFPHAGPSTASSCPNLYVWNGAKFQFVTDLAGSDVGKISKSTGKFTEIFPDLPVAIPWSMLQEKNGKYTIKIKSERDEVDFIDNAVLMAVDHPVGTRIASNELNRGGQEPVKLYTYSANLKPVKKATYANIPVFSEGKPTKPVDVTALVAKLDNSETPGSYQDDNQLTFDLGDMSSSEQIKLVLTGWTEFTDGIERIQANTKIDQGRKGAKNFLEILQPDGSWKKENIKHISGMSRTVVLDLTGKFPKDSKDYVVRLRGFIRPHFDFAGVDTTPQAQYTVSTPKLLEATLAYRGASTVTKRPSPDFNYDLLQKQVVFHEGNFTKFGDVLPLVKAVDDQLVVMDIGDEITLNFQALQPPAAGMTRTFVLQPWSYYKEGKLAQAQPIPFRQMDMNKLPTSLGEYPAELKAYSAEWNTRVHHEGQRAELGYLDQLKDLLAKLWAWFAHMWQALLNQVFGEANQPQPILQKATVEAAAKKANKPERHYSINTDYVELDVRAADSDTPAGYCNNCHNPHGKDDGYGSPITKQLREAPESVCFGGGMGCHSQEANSFRGINIADKFSAGANATARHSVSAADQQATGSKIACTNCHDPHLNTATSKVIDPFNPTTPYNFTNGMTNYIGADGEVYLMVKSKHDGRPPVITSGPLISAMTATGCTIRWWTDEPTFGYVDFGPTSGYGSTANSIAGLGTAHTAYITGLSAGQNYHFQVRSVDASGNYVNTADALLDSVAPTINAPGPAFSMNGTSATITWTTNEAATSYVDYAPDDVYSVSGYVYSSDPNSTYTTNHSITLNGLTVATDYHISVRSADFRGNSVSGSDQEIKASDPPSVPVLNVYPDQLQGTTPFTANLSWNASTDPNSDPISYFAQLSGGDPAFANPINSAWQAGINWSVQIDNWDDLTWYWRVKAMDQWGAASVWSSVYSFVHRGPPTPASCPNLYVWDGKTYKFVTDLAGSDVGKKNGTTGKYIEVAPDLKVIIPWKWLQAKDGKYPIIIKSERDEVDFIDNLQLMAVDHPIGTQIALNDLNRGQEVTQIYTYYPNLLPLKQATYYNNPIYTGNKPTPKQDITDLLAKVDNREIVGFQGDDNQLTFDLGDMSKAKAIKLVMVGMTEYAKTKDEKAANNDKLAEGIMRAKNALEILQPDGSWKREDIKHFNGMTKTVVLDLNGKFPKGTKQYVIRLRGMNRPRIDFVGIDTQPSAKYTVRTTKLLDATLRFRGSSQISSDGKDFIYDQVEGKTILHEGNFTRYGDVLPLIQNIDDKLVVMDTGDEMLVNFQELPPPAEGMTRSFILQPWQYYKETELGKVEPMPFRNMDLSKLPESLGEYPAELKQYAAEWNTRVHQAGEKPDPGLWDKLKRFLASIWESLTKLWNSLFGGEKAALNSASQLAYQPKLPAWWTVPDPEKHYSLNTNYITLQVDDTVNTYVYDVNSDGVAIWEGSILAAGSNPAPATGVDASAQKAKLAADDSQWWTTDNYAAPNQGDGNFNYQMFKFKINTPADKLFSLKALWKGYGELSTGYNTTLLIWNFNSSSWEQIDNKVIGVDASMSFEKNVDLNPYCYKCHAGTVPTGVQLGTINPNISSSYTTDIHGSGAGRQNLNVRTDGEFSTSNVDTGAIAAPYKRDNAALPCNDCHDTHGSSNAYHLRENLNGSTDIAVPNVNYSNNTDVLNYCKTCHVGTLNQFHQACLDCHYQAHDCSPPVADDFGQSCISCHKHGGTMPAHGLCHCYLAAPAKAF